MRKLLRIFSLKRIQGFIELTITLFMGYIFFPTSGNLLFIVLKLMVWLFLIYFIYFYTNALLDSFRHYIERNRLNWMRDSYEAKYTLAMKFTDNNTLRDMFIWIINLIIGRKRSYAWIEYYVKYEKTISFLMAVILLAGIYLIFIFVF